MKPEKDTRSLMQRAADRAVGPEPQRVYRNLFSREGVTDLDVMKRGAKKHGATHVIVHVEPYAEDLMSATHLGCSVVEL